MPTRERTLKRHAGAKVYHWTREDIQRQANESGEVHLYKGEEIVPEED